MPDILLGTSGWSYAEWVGPFYQEKRGMLEQYSKCFTTVEVDSTFYSYPKSFMVRSWARRTPQDFRFSLKIPQLITHDKALDPSKGVADDLHRFLQLLEPLRENEKLGPLLLQMAPSFTFDPELLESFFDLLPDGYNFAIEFRHPSWLQNDTTNLLRKHAIAYVCVDEPLLPADIIATNPQFAYIRWHGRGTRPWYNYRYDQPELQPWTDKVETLSKDTKTVYGYFNNHFHGFAIVNCLEMIKMLGALTDEQQARLELATEYLEKPSIPSAKEPQAQGGGLDQFIYKPASVEEMLRDFMDEGRLQRAKAIPTSEISVKEMSPTKTLAEIRGYTITINTDTRELSHNCDDWAKSAQTKRFCKHIAALFLSLPEKQAEPILRGIVADREGWDFQQG